MLSLEYRQDSKHKFALNDALWREDNTEGKILWLGKLKGFQVYLKTKINVFTILNLFHIRKTINNIFKKIALSASW